MMLMGAPSTSTVAYTIVITTSTEWMPTVPERIAAIRSMTSTIVVSSHGPAVTATPVT